MAISTEQRILIEQRVTNEAKSLGIAYLLWFFVGGLGAHRFYLGRPISALILILLGPIGLALMLSKNHYGAFMLVAAALWLVVDAFLIPGMGTAWKNKVRNELTAAAERAA